MTTPTRVQNEGFRWLPTVIIGIAVTGVIIFLLAYFTQVLGFSFQNRDVAQQLKVGKVLAGGNYSITQNSKAYQDAQLGIMTQALSAIEGAGGIASVRAGLPSGDAQAAPRAQELYELRTFCGASLNIVPENQEYALGSPSLKQLVAANCVSGVANASPPLAMNPVPDGGI